MRKATPTVGVLTAARSHLRNGLSAPIRIKLSGLMNTVYLLVIAPGDILYGDMYILFILVNYNPKHSPAILSEYSIIEPISEL